MSGRMLVDPDAGFCLGHIPGEELTKRYNQSEAEFTGLKIGLLASNPEVHYRDGRVLNDLDAIIPRIRPSATFYGCAVTRHFESLGVHALNSAAAITQSRDKLYSLQLLLEINSSPGLEGIETATGKDIAGAMIASIEKHLGWQRKLAVEKN